MGSGGEVTGPADRQDSAGDTGSDEPGAAWSTGLSLTGAAVLFVVLRLFAVSDYDWVRAASVADTIGLDDAPRMVLATLMADPRVTAVVLAVLVPVSLVHQWRLGMPSFQNAGNLAMLIVVVLFGAVLLITIRLWWMLIIVGVVGVLVIALQTTAHRDPEGRRFALGVMHRSGAVAILAMLAAAAIVRVPWAPLERIETRDGTVIGYVLANPPGFLKVLTDEDREIMIIGIDHVRSREEIQAKS
ncbi:hypothetical protein ABZ412_21420 [Nocardia sp. NPDC005746]|uniref:hypothetical protein n=1 Tax=Nocardia sp. NPDC005746 TaxID=3157062 RepID=UPI0033D6DBFC